MSTQSVLTIIAAVLGSGIIAALINIFFNRAKEIEFRKLQEMETRYKATHLYMASVLDKKHLTVLCKIRQDIKTVDDVVSELEAEYFRMFLYAPKRVIIAMKLFIENPNWLNYYEVLINMRRGLWVKKWRLITPEIILKRG